MQLKLSIVAAVACHLSLLTAQQEASASKTAAFVSPFAKPEALTAAGERVLIKNHGFTSGTAVDLNKDGLFDMVVGWYDYDTQTSVASQQGAVYFNIGTRKAPKFGKAVPLTADGSKEFRDTY